jgi:hypothetical protein
MQQAEELHSPTDDDRDDLSEDLSEYEDARENRLSYDQQPDAHTSALLQSDYTSALLQKEQAMYKSEQRPKSLQCRKVAVALVLLIAVVAASAKLYFHFLNIRSGGGNTERKFFCLQHKCHGGHSNASARNYPSRGTCQANCAPAPAPPRRPPSYAPTVRPTIAPPAASLPCLREYIKYCDASTPSDCIDCVAKNQPALMQGGCTPLRLRLLEDHCNLLANSSDVIQCLDAFEQEWPKLCGENESTVPRCVACFAAKAVELAASTGCGPAELRLLSSSACEVPEMPVGMQCTREFIAACAVAAEVSAANCSDCVRDHRGYLLKHGCTEYNINDIDALCPLIANTTGNLLPAYTCAWRFAADCAQTLTRADCSRCVKAHTADLLGPGKCTQEQINTFDEDVCPLINVLEADCIAAFVIDCAASSDPTEPHWASTNRRPAAPTPSSSSLGGRRSPGSSKPLSATQSDFVISAVSLVEAKRAQGAGDDIGSRQSAAALSRALIDVTGLDAGIADTFAFAYRGVAVVSAKSSSARVATSSPSSIPSPCTSCIATHAPDLRDSGCTNDDITNRLPRLCPALANQSAAWSCLYAFSGTCMPTAAASPSRSGSVGSVGSVGYISSEDSLAVISFSTAAVSALHAAQQAGAAAPPPPPLPPLVPGGVPVPQSSVDRSSPAPSPLALASRLLPPSPSPASQCVECVNKSRDELAQRGCTPNMLVRLQDEACYRTSNTTRELRCLALFNELCAYPNYNTLHGCRECVLSPVNRAKLAADGKCTPQEYGPNGMLLAYACPLSLDAACTSEFIYDCKPAVTGDPTVAGCQKCVAKRVHELEACGCTPDSQTVLSTLLCPVLMDPAAAPLQCYEAFVLDCSRAVGPAACSACIVSKGPAWDGRGCTPDLRTLFRQYVCAGWVVAPKCVLGFMAKCGGVLSLQPPAGGRAKCQQCVGDWSTELMRDYGCKHADLDQLRTQCEEPPAWSEALSSQLRGAHAA